MFQKILRPGLAVLIAVLDVALIVASSNAAKDFAIRAGRTADRICKEKRECAHELAGFTCGDGNCRAFAGLTARYPVRYQTAPDKRTFRIGIRFSIDNHLLVAGGVKERMSASNFYDSVEEKIEL